MNMEQLSSMIHDHGTKIAIMETRQCDLEKITMSVHELARHVAAMTTEVKILAENTDKSIIEIKQGQKSQGERIGVIELSVLQIQRNEKDIIQIADKLDVIRMEPANKWKSLLAQLIGLLIAASVGALFAGNFFFN